MRRFNAPIVDDAPDNASDVTFDRASELSIVIGAVRSDPLHGSARKTKPNDGPPEGGHYGK